MPCSYYQKVTKGAGIVSLSNQQRLGKRIVTKRGERKWNQKQLAEAAGINPGYLSMIEHGNKFPSVATLHKLRDALNLDDDVFLAWLDLMKPEAKPNRGEAA